MGCACNVGEGIVFNNPSTCEGCVTGTFTDRVSQETCASRADCPAGTRITNFYAVTADSNCEACPVGTFTDTINQEVCAARAVCPVGTYITNLDEVDVDSNCEYCTADLVNNSIDDSCLSDVNASSSAVTPTGAIVGSVAGFALFFLLVGISRFRQRQKVVTADAVAPRGRRVPDGPPQVAARHWIMSLGTSTAANSAPHEEVLPGANAEADGAQPSHGALITSLDALAGGLDPGCSHVKTLRTEDVYDTPDRAYEQSNTGAGYERPAVRVAARSRDHQLRTVSVDPGYTPLSENHKRADPDTHTLDDRLCSGNALPRSRAALATATGYARLDGMQQIYVRDADRAVVSNEEFRGEYTV